jgi:integrase
LVKVRSKCEVARQYGVSRRWVIADLCIDIVLPKKPDIRKTFDDVLTAVEVDRLVAALGDVGEKYQSLRTNGRYSAPVFMGAWLGPRWNEAIGVRICDLDVLRREAHRPGPAGGHRRARRAHRPLRPRPDRSRGVPVHQQVQQAPAAVERHPRVPPRASPRRTRRASGDLADPAAHRREPDVRRRPVDLEVQQRLGHKDPTLTMCVYTHLTRERFEEGRERLEAYICEKRQEAEQPLSEAE